MILRYKKFVILHIVLPFLEFKNYWNLNQLKYDKRTKLFSSEGVCCSCYCKIINIDILKYNIKDANEYAKSDNPVTVMEGNI